MVLMPIESTFQLLQVSLSSAEFVLHGNAVGHFSAFFYFHHFEVTLYNLPDIQKTTPRLCKARCCGRSWVKKRCQSRKSIHITAVGLSSIGLFPKPVQTNTDFANDLVGSKKALYLNLIASKMESNLYSSPLWVIMEFFVSDEFCLWSDTRFPYAGTLHIQGQRFCVPLTGKSG